MIEPLRRDKDFPCLQSMVYLNTAAEGIPPTAVGKALEQYWQDKLKGADGRKEHFEILESCGVRAARLLRLSPEEIGFCSCSAEAYNLLAGALNLQAGDEVVINDLDFPSGATPWFAGNASCLVRLWRSTKGELHLDELERQLSDRTRLVQISLVSFLNGFRVDWPGLAHLVRDRSPQAVLSVDVTQALGRCEVDCSAADCIISSTHKWLLGIHGGCIIGIPERNAERLTTRAGGWFHLHNAFSDDRFQRTSVKKGAASYGVGMPNFAAIYALNAALSYLENVGIGTIACQGDKLAEQLHVGLAALGISPLAPWRPERPTGIIAFSHPRSDQLQTIFEQNKIQVMHGCGRLRLSVHGYNTTADVECFLRVLAGALAEVGAK